MWKWADTSFYNSAAIWLILVMWLLSLMNMAATSPSLGTVAGRQGGVARASRARREAVRAVRAAMVAHPGLLKHCSAPRLSGLLLQGKSCIIPQMKERRKFQAVRKPLLFFV